MSTPEKAPSSVWFPPDIVKSFLLIKRALSRRRFSQVDYFSKKYQKLFPAYKGYYQEKEALAHKMRGRKEKALELLKKANAFFESQSLPTLANLIKELPQTGEEVDKYIQQGLIDFPGSDTLLFLKTNVDFEKGHIKKAIEQIEELYKKDSLAIYQYLLGEYHFELGQYAQAVAAFKECQKKDPALTVGWCNHIFFSHYMPCYSHQNLIDSIQEWYKTVCLPLPKTNPVFLKRKLKKTKKIRIGLLSSGFRKHPVGWMAAKSLHYLSRLPDYELYFYSLGENIDHTDSLRKIFKSASSKWVDIEDIGEELYKKVLHDKLDIAIDLNGHGQGYILPLFSRRLAPIQIKWVGGLFDTTGVPEMDYLLTDRYQTPDGCDNEYAEKLVRLPNSYISYSLLDYGEQKRLRKNENEPICFGCFNNRYKLNPVIAEVWSRILKKVPGSILFLKDVKMDLPEIKEYKLKLFTDQGIEKERIHIEGASPHDELMLCYNRVDIALDPWPYTGGLTTLEALWMGVPVITTPGPSFAGKHATSHLCNVGLQMLVTENFDQYVELAVNLANNQPLLDELRTLIPYSLATSPIVRHEQLAADLDTAFRTMWERYCDGLPPIAMRFEQQSEIPELFFNKEKD